MQQKLSLLMNKGKVVQIVNVLDITNSIRKPEEIGSIFNFDNALKHYQSTSGHFVLKILDYDSNQIFTESEWDIGILQSWKNALNCYATTIYAGAILFASISVECVLNHDTRLEDFRKGKNHEWIDLTYDNLKKAKKYGLPTESLLGAKENFPNLSFVNRRNKIAHGDTEGYRKLSIPENIVLGENYTNEWQPTQSQALDQIEKAKRFIIDWAQSQPEIRLH